MKTAVLHENLKFPEGPVVAPDGSIYFVELLGECITQYHRESKTITRFMVGGRPNGMMVKDNDTLIFCDAGQNAIRSLTISTGITQTLVDQIEGVPFRSPNDLIMDKKGNILFTCPGGSDKEAIGYMCCLDSFGTVSLIAEGMYFPNGLLLINDEKQIIINESWGHRLLIGDWDSDQKKILNIRSFYEVGGNAEPDGLALSKDNLIYAAIYNTGKVWVFDLKGNLIKQLTLLGNCPTNLYFDEVGDLGLIVTEAERGMLVSVIE